MLLTSKSTLVDQQQPVQPVAMRAGNRTGAETEVVTGVVTPVATCFFILFYDFPETALQGKNGSCLKDCRARQELRASSTNVETRTVLFKKGVNSY